MVGYYCLFCPVTEIFLDKLFKQPKHDVFCQVGIRVVMYKKARYWIRKDYAEKILCGKCLK